MSSAATQTKGRTTLDKTTRFTPPAQRRTSMGGSTAKKGAIRSTKMYGSR